MIWKRLKKSSPENESDFKERMSDERLPVQDKVIMILTSFVVIVLPCALILIGMSLLMLWVFGLL